MASYNDIVTKGKSLADVISRSVANKAPVKTGNLKRALRRANNVNTMFDSKGFGSKNIKSKDITISIDYAPDDAPYGKWWNDPTVSKTVRNGKTKNVPKAINFVDQALNDPNFKRAFDELVELMADNLIAQIEDNLNEMESEY
jgi:hypothetical protein